MERSIATHYANPDLPLWRETLAGFDWMRLRLSAVYAGRGVDRGSGQPVVLVPGFMASDTSLIELKAWLDRMGYRAYYSDFGRNDGCPKDLTASLCEAVEAAHTATRARVTVIGHSLGGCLARATAIRCPERIDRVITLGSPVRGAAIHPLVLRAGEAVHADCDEACFLPMQAALPRGVRETNIFTRTDGVVDPGCCVSDGAARIEVRGTHVGLIWNPEVYRALGRILAPPARRPHPIAAYRRQELALAS